MSESNKSQEPDDDIENDKIPFLVIENSDIKQIVLIQRLKFMSKIYQLSIIGQKAFYIIMKLIEYVKQQVQNKLPTNFKLFAYFVFRNEWSEL